MMKIKKTNYLGLIHETVQKKFEGNLSFVNYMCIEGKHGDYFTAAVYEAAKPNRDKGHKDYMLIFEHGSQFYVSGRDREEIAKDRVHDGLWCKGCDEVLVSLNRHDYVKCDCPNESFIDGGKDYLRTGAKDMALTEIVKVDLLTDEISFDRN